MHAWAKTTRWTTCLLVLIAGCAAQIAAAQDAEKQPAPAVSEAPENVDRATGDRSSSDQPPAVSPREILATLGLGDEFFAGFTDGQPVDSAEREKLLTLLFRLPQISRPVLEGAAQPPGALRKVRSDPAAHRGEIFLLRVGRVHRVVREQLPDDLKARFGFGHFYRCQANLLGEPCEIYTLAVPAAWKLNRTIDEECGAWGMFVKDLPVPIAKDEDATESSEDENPVGAPTAENAPPLLFVADRVAWHPATLLGFLGVDYGLFDQVRDRTPLTEREIFYQMLAAASRMSDEYLQFQIDRLIKDQRATLERLVRNRDLPAKMRADAERGWERAQQGASDVVPLFNDPASQRGRFLVLQGEALRAIEVRVDDPDIVKRFGIDHYYEIEIVTPDSQNNPLVCCVARIPSAMPLGNEIHEHVQVAGFFLKSWAFNSRRGDPLRNNSELSGKTDAQREPQERQLAPLLIGPTIEVLTPPRFQAPTQSLQLAGGLLVVLAGFGVAMWYVRRADRRAAERLATQRNSLPEQIRLDDASDPAHGKF